jgi:hypothetical protein
MWYIISWAIQIRWTRVLARAPVPVLAPSPVVIRCSRTLGACSPGKANRNNLSLESSDTVVSPFAQSEG